MNSDLLVRLVMAHCVMTQYNGPGLLTHDKFFSGLSTWEDRWKQVGMWNDCYQTFISRHRNEPQLGMGLELGEQDLVIGHELITRTLDSLRGVELGGIGQALQRAMEKLSTRRYPDPAEDHAGAMES